MQQRLSQKWGKITILAFLCLLVSSLYPGAHPILAASNTVSVSKSIIGEGSDFATLVLGQPWDMSKGPYPDFPNATGGIDRGTFNVSQGSWSFKATSSDPNIMIHPFNIPGTQKVLKLGDSFPIDPSQYKLFSFRLWSSASTYGNVYWFYNQDWRQGKNSSPISIQTGWHTYVVDLSTDPNWNGSISGLRLDPGSTANIQYKLDWIRLTTKDVKNSVSIDWKGSTSARIYINNTCSFSADATLIKDNNNTNKPFMWGSNVSHDGSGLVYPIPESFQPGTYEIVVVDGQNPVACTPITIDQAPILEFQKPSRRSGPDYATVVGGNPWGMIDSGDLASTYDIANINFNEGIFHGTTGSTGDPRIVLNSPSQINADVYKYATFRMYLEGQQNVGLGWVQRFYWWSGTPDLSNFGITKDMVVYEGWHTYTIDLSAAPLEPGRGWRGSINELRFDPDEVPAALGVNLDFVQLTGDETITSGQVFPITYTINAGTAQSLQLYYGPQRNSISGRTQISRVEPTTFSTPDSTKIHQFLPMLVNRYSTENNFIQGLIQSWDTRNIAPGTYYISADVSDGVMTTTWYSEVSVIVR